MFLSLVSKDYKVKGTENYLDDGSEDEDYGLSFDIAVVVVILG